jgi:O-antigen ligase
VIARQSVYQLLQTVRQVPSLNAILLLAVLWWHLLPNTAVIEPITWGFFRFLDLLLFLGLLQPLYATLGYDALIYTTGIALSVTFLLPWLAMRSTLQPWAKPTDRVMVALVLWYAVYLTDWLHSGRIPYSYDDTWWIGYPLSVFLFAMLMVEHRSLPFLAKGIGVAVAVQATYAIGYHWLDIRQFHTPHFGARTGGTLGTPNHLYPVLLLGIPLCLALALGAPRRWEQALWVLNTVLCFVALWYTYTRTAWIALALTLPLFTVRQRALIRARWAKGGLYALCASLLLATALVRTGGQWLGNPQDRSFWGRFAIWQVAISVIAEHPIIGNGVGSYHARQRAHMTEHLLSFDPMNTEPKNLYLLIASDVGMVGLVLFLLVLWRYVQLYRQGMARLGGDPAAKALVVGCTLGLLSVLVAGMADSPVLEFGRTGATLVAMALLGITVRQLDAGFEHLRFSREEIARRERGFLLRAGLALLAVVMVVSIPPASALWQFQQHRSQVPLYRTVVPPRPLFTPLTEIAEPMRDALIASEDGYFYQHRGVDWQALHRALRVNIRNLAFKQGGSTITMQTARYLFLGREKTLSRKVAEILLALEMEKHLSKERILELYLNSARFGLGAEDIGTACRVYFGKSPKDLTLGEAAFLAGVLPEPPRTRSELTLEKVYRCQRRALSRLAYFFPMRYSSQQLAQAMQERVVFVWER